MTEQEALDLKWAAASEFIRDVLFALGRPEPPPKAVVNLREIAAQVVGQIEELKVENVGLNAKIDFLCSDPVRRECDTWHANYLAENELRQTAEAELAQVRAEGAALVSAVQRAKTFIEYARYELQPGKSTIGDQFPRQQDADEVLAELTAVVARLAGEPHP